MVPQLSGTYDVSQKAAGKGGKLRIAPLWQSDQTWKRVPVEEGTRSPLLFPKKQSVKT